MDPQVLTQAPQFVLRRIFEAPPAWSVWLPVGFALFVVYVLGLMRQDRKTVAALLLPVFMLLIVLAGFRGDFVFRIVGRSFDWAIWLPICIAAMVVYLSALFWTDVRLRGMLTPMGIVTAIGVVYAVAGLRSFLLLFSWWYLLAPTLGLALVYVALMYRKDARSVHPAVAGFLGLLRGLVYLILAAVFLLPGCQTYELTEYHAKTLFLFDVSDSVVTTIDDRPEANQDPATLPTRQDKVIRFLANGNKDARPFLDVALAKTPITAYRFGAMLDESDIQTWKNGHTPSIDALNAWLKPHKDNFSVPEKMPQEEKDKLRLKYQEHVEALRAGTNIGGAAQQMAKLEANNYLQAVVIVSDGQSNMGSEESLRDAINRWSSGKRKVPIVTVGVGEFRQPASLRIDDLLAPETARPDDKFPIRVPVVGQGLTDEEFTVTLEATRIKDSGGQPVVGEKTYSLGPKKGKLQGGGDYQTDNVEFEIDVKELKDVKKEKDDDGELEGTWSFVAKVPRNPREAFAKAEHVTDPPTEVIVQKRKLRVLLFAGGPTREYQFLRTLLYREVTEKRLELSIHLQTGRDEDHVDQDVESERFLRNFPNRIGPADAGEKHMSLTDYDVLIAIDPDWLALGVDQFKLLKDWVGTHAGGIVFVAGPVHTYQLALPAGIDISALKTLLPVSLQDSRLQGLGGVGHDTSRPYILNFPVAAKPPDFLKLDETGDTPTAGWDKFFWEDGHRPDSVKDVKPKRGFYNYYPVDKIKADSSVIATFAGPDSTRINDGKDEQPFIVSMRFGSGKSMYIGSAETWRLRHMKDVYHERFWVKLARYMTSGTTQQKRYGRMMLARSVTVGNIAFEAQLKGKDLLPLPADLHPTVYIKRLDNPDGPPRKDESFDLKARQGQGDWGGWFAGNVRMKEPGEYEFRIPIPGTTESLTQRLTVRKPNPELDNLRNNFGLLYQLASEAKEMIDPLPAETRSKILRMLDVVADEKAPEGKVLPRLFFRLERADAVGDCLRLLAPKRDLVKGKLYDLWDDGVASGWTASSYHLAWGTPLFVGLIGTVILLIFGQNLFAGLFFAAGFALAMMPVIYDLIWSPTWPALPLNMSFVLVAVVGLLGVEWLTRKLLKLA